jgi:hypothetical protein
LLKGFMAESLLPAIKGHSNMIGLVLADQLPHHSRKAIDRIGGQSPIIGQVSDSIKCPEDMRHAINEEEALGGMRTHSYSQLDVKTQVFCHFEQDIQPEFNTTVPKILQSFR